MARNREATITPEAVHTLSAEGRLLDEVAAVMSFAAAVFALLSFASVHIGSANENFAGRVGHELADVVIPAFGFAAYLFPFFLAVVSILTFCRATAHISLPRATGVLIIIVSTAILLGLARPDLPINMAGGWVGQFLGICMAQAFGRQGSFVLTGMVLVLSAMFVTRLSIQRSLLLFRAAPAGASAWIRRLIPRSANGSVPQTPRRRVARKALRDPSGTGPVIVLADELDREEKKGGRRPVQEEFDFSENGRYQIPSLSLLDSASHSKVPIDEQVLRKSSQILEGKLADFGIEGKVVEVRPGPVITTFDIEPAPGVKVSRVVSLSDDLAMALRVPGVRILAPVPGKAVVGIEVANPRRDQVRLREILESDSFCSSTSSLTLALGKDTAGSPVSADLSRMPHLLIAGATGSGKSVALNAMIMSILYKSSPRDVRFLMIDMKMLELSVYENIPHLLVPVVTEPKKAVVVLKNLVEQVEERYRLMKQRAVRGIDGYNRLIEREEVSRQTGLIELNVLADDEPEGSNLDSTPLPRERLPKIVVIVDELADLMMTMGRHVEEPITRLAQKARAAGIHLILATQRPSVDVITGLIKANFPARVSFQTTSRVDSRTILDQIGAERLLGGGDMLYMPAGSARVQRLHGPLVTETEILRVANFIKKQGAPQYAFDLLEAPEDDNGDGDLEDDLSDELYDQAVRLVTESRQASISWVQRRLRVGYNRAARMIERMEREGVVSPGEGGRPREVLARRLDDE